jgi:hypothetical protein
MVKEAKKIKAAEKKERTVGTDPDSEKASPIDLAQAMEQASQIPLECVKAISHVLDTEVDPELARVIRLVNRFDETNPDDAEKEREMAKAKEVEDERNARTAAKADARTSRAGKLGWSGGTPVEDKKRGKGKARSFDAVAAIIGKVENAKGELVWPNTFYMYTKGMEQLQAAVEAKPMLLQACYDFLMGTSYPEDEVAKRDVSRAAWDEKKAAAKKGGGDEDDDTDEPMVELLKELFEGINALEYPSEMVAQSMEDLLLAEGVKIRRKGKKITIPVNEYGRAKKAFEKHGLTLPKKYVSHEADNIRKMASFSGQYGGGLDKSF